MKFHSTRDHARRVSMSRTLIDGLAPDGGLYVPESFPDLEPDDFEGCESIEAVAARMLHPFVEDDRLEGDLEAICEETFEFPVPLRQLDEQTSLLELFHGPTAAFKDVGARFLASSLSRLESDATQPLTILVATSGDTGAAVASAFYGKPNVEVVVLYPLGRVSERQEQLLTCWDDNVRTFGVAGDFDDCQRIVKEAFADDWWSEHMRLSSANSINLGRLLPQATYYAHAALERWRETGEAPDVVVPTGNAGNALAALYARRCGLPIGEVVLATNANRPITHYLETGEWETFETVETLATAMDVGDPSNFERIRHLYPDVDELREALSARRVGDDAIEETIRSGPDEWGEVWDPHTACAVRVREQLESDDAIVVSTAHPAKFPEVVEPLIGREVEIPEGMATWLERPTQSTEIEPDLEALTREVRVHRRG